MDDDRFDALTRSLALVAERRRLLGSAGVGLVTALGVRHAEAEPRRRGPADAATPRAVETEAKCRPESPAKVRRHIRAAAKRYNQPYKKLLCVAQCESSLNNCAVNRAGKTYGLFQYLDSTWKSTPFKGKSVFDAKANADATAWMWKEGNENQWDCCCPKFKCKCPGKTPSWC
jgi:hypothetical protein